MARRQFTLDTAINQEDAMGNSISYDLVRITAFYSAPFEKKVLIDWQIGRLNGGNWEQAGRLGGQESYTDASYETILSAGTVAQICDQFYADLVTATKVGSGTAGDWPEDA